MKSSREADLKAAGGLDAPSKQVSSEGPGIRRAGTVKYAETAARDLNRGGKTRGKNDNRRDAA